MHRFDSDEIDVIAALFQHFGKNKTERLLSSHMIYMHGGRSHPDSQAQRELVAALFQYTNHNVARTCRILNGAKINAPGYKSHWTPYNIDGFR